MKQYLLYLCAASLFFSCSKSDETSPDEGADGKMHFAANIPEKDDDWSRATRGPVTDNSNIADFGAFCFHTERSKWEEISSHATPNKMFNVKVMRTPGTDEWTYTPAVEWNGGDMAYFTFFGYAPYATPDNGITAPTSAAVAGAPLLGFVVGDDVPKQVDLLVAKPVYNTAPVAKVKMQFAHALSGIGFKAFSQTEGIKVSKIQITGVKYKGDVTLEGSWSSAPETKDFAITYPTPIALPVDATTTETAVNLSVEPNGFFLLPQDLKSNTSAKIIFTFTILDGAEITKEYVIKETWVKGKRITYTVDLTTNLEEPLIVTKVSITDWALGGDAADGVDGVAREVDLTFNDGGTVTPGGKGMQNAEYLISMRPTNPLETWNTKADGSGKYYGQGDMIIMKNHTTLYNVDNTVTIGGMRWLRGNLSGTAGSDAGYYAESSPARSGMLFQGGDSWVYAHESNTTDDLRDWGLAFVPSTTYTRGYDYVGITGGRSAGDPCMKLGAGFMTPTVAQFETLNSLGSAKGAYRGVDGMFFGPNAAACTNELIAAECIFMPLAGARDWRSGETVSVGQGNYWTSSVGYEMHLWEGNASPNYANQTWAYSVRCVSTDVTVRNVIWTNTNLTGPAAQDRNHRMAAYPQDYGNVYKWGDKWVYLRETSETDNLKTPNNDNIVYTWRAATSPAVPTGTNGYDYGNNLTGGPAPGDPCKILGPNYRTPTGADYNQLDYTNKKYEYYKGVYGVFLGERAAECTSDKIAPDCLFLPFGGCRELISGHINQASTDGFYWLSSVSNSQSQTSAYVMRIFYGKVLIGVVRYRGDGLSVRCVRDATIK